MWWIAGFYAEPYSYVVLPRPDSKPANPIIQATLSSGNGLMRPLEATAKKASVQISIEHKMTGILGRRRVRSRARHRGRQQWLPS
jgi:hypothetical protein